MQTFYDFFMSLSEEEKDTLASYLEVQCLTKEVTVVYVSELKDLNNFLESSKEWDVTSIEELMTILQECKDNNMSLEDLHIKTDFMYPWCEEKIKSYGSVQEAFKKLLRPWAAELITNVFEGKDWRDDIFSILEKAGIVSKTVENRFVEVVRYIPNEPTTWFCS